MVSFGASAEAALATKAESVNGDNEPEKRIIFTGVGGFGYQPEDFLNKQFLFVTNLEPRKMPSYIETSEGKLLEYSQGMILAVDSEPDSEGKTKPIFISADNLPLGSKVR